MCKLTGKDWIENVVIHKQLGVAWFWNPFKMVGTYSKRAIDVVLDEMSWLRLVVKRDEEDKTKLHKKNTKIRDCSWFN